MWNSGCRGQVWFSRVSQPQPSMSLRSPSSFFAVSEDLGRVGKRQPIPKPCQWVAINSKWGVRSQADGWTREVGTQDPLLLAIFTLQSWSQSDTPKLPTSLPSGRYSYTDYHIPDLPLSITGPLSHFPIRPSSPPSTAAASKVRPVSTQST